MKRTIHFIALLIIVHSGSLFAQNSPVATVHKPVGTVEMKKESSEWQKARPATPLFSGDVIKTGENSFAIIKFIENSILRVQEKSEITINGDIDKKSKEFSKNVYLEQGKLGFDVKKRPNEKFEFSTPTSVASIRGTGGLLIAGSDSNDVLILRNGIVNFFNNFSNQSVIVSGGQTAFSMSNGGLTVEESSPEELRLLEQQEKDTTNQGSGDQGSGDQGNNEGEAEGSSTSESGITLGLSITAPVVIENKPLEVSVEITNVSIPFDSLKSIISQFTLYYRAKSDQTYKPLTLSSFNRTNRFSIPAQEVFAPSMQVYVQMRLNDGTEFTQPTSSPEQNPAFLPIQDAKRNEIKLEFTDPTGKRKKLIIEYK